MGGHVAFGFYGDLGWSLIASAIIAYPLWRIFRRADLNPFLSLFVFIPFAGGFVVALLLGFSRWPAAERSTARGSRPWR